MNEVNKSKFPKWCKDKNYAYDLCLTDDLDSFLSCLALQNLTNAKIKYFYDFYTLSSTDTNDDICWNNFIGVDMDCTYDKCWGNHVSAIKNKKAANLNTICDITQKNYFSKYAGNTILTILSYFNIDITQYNEEQLMILLCTDAMYKGFYSSGGFHDAHVHFVKDVLQYPKLFEIEREHTMQDFLQIGKKYNIFGKIRSDEDGCLHTNINLKNIGKAFESNYALPQMTFNPRRKYADLPMSYMQLQKKFNPLKTFTAALTNKNFTMSSKLLI